MEIIEVRDIEGNVISREDLAWAAGLFDGEGSAVIAHTGAASARGGKYGHIS